MNIYLDRSESAIKAHAERVWPEESCGIVTMFDGYIECDNIADNPLQAFEIDSALIQRLLGEIVAIVHSHPYPFNACPSVADMNSQIAMGVSFGIVPMTIQGGASDPFYWGGDIQPPTLIGRMYRHGVTDCYALVRDYFAEQMKFIPDVARDWGWWKKDMSMFEGLFDQCGFKEVAYKDAQMGDGLLIRVRGDYIHHCGVWVEDDQLLHHPCGQYAFDPCAMSTLTPLDEYMPYVAKVVRCTL